MISTAPRKNLTARQAERAGARTTELEAEIVKLKESLSRRDTDLATIQKHRDLLQRELRNAESHVADLTQNNHALASQINEINARSAGQ